MTYPTPARTITRQMTPMMIQTVAEDEEESSVVVESVESVESVEEVSVESSVVVSVLESSVVVESVEVVSVESVVVSARNYF